MEKSRVSVAKRWCFTAFDEMDTLVTQIKSSGMKYIIGRETCSTTGRLHLQGYVESETRFRPMEKFGTKTVHWEKAKGDQASNISYCSKEGDYETNLHVRKPCRDPFLDLVPYDWQRNVLDIVKAPVDPRKIYWIWEGNGCSGKSTLAKHLCMSYNALVVGGKGQDIKFAVANYLESKDLDILIYDVPRSVGNTVSYSSIEEIKNGCMFSSKYESGMSIFNPPHILVFSNVEPDLTSLSLDRWVIIDI